MRKSPRRLLRGENKRSPERSWYVTNNARQAKAHRCPGPADQELEQGTGLLYPLSSLGRPSAKEGGDWGKDPLFSSDNSLEGQDVRAFSSIQVVSVVA